MAIPRQTLPTVRAPKFVYALPFLTDVAAMLLIFAVGRYLAEAGATLLTLGLIGGGHALTAAVSSFITGPLSDRVGRERLILPGMAVFLVAAVVCIIVPPGRFVSVAMYWTSALSLGMIHPATIAWVNSGEPASKSVRSRGVSGNLVRFCISWNLGVLAAQFGGGELFLISPRLPFIVSAAVMLVDLGIAVSVARVMGRARVRAIAKIDSAEVPAHGPNPETAAADSLSDTFVRLAWLANLGGAIAVSMMLHLFPRLAVGLGVPADNHGAILASMRVVAITVYVLLHHTAFWQYRFSISLTVQSIAVAGLLCIAAAQSTVMLLVGVWGVSMLLGFNYFSGIYYGSAGHEEERRGFASGMHEATLGLGIAIGSAGGGLFGHLIGERIPYVLAAGALVLLMSAQAVRFVRFRLRTAQGE